MTKFKWMAVAMIAICLVLIWSAIKLKSHQSVEFDEGVYLTTFKSVQHGFPLYQKTFFSQLPGFFLTVFPLYSLFGSTLEGGRMAIFVYSLLGLGAILWLGWELKSVAFSFLAIGGLYLIPIYTSEILTLQADSLPATFSTLALAAVYRWQNTGRVKWLGLSSIMAAMALLIKADGSILPSIFIILILTKPKKILKSFTIMALGFGSTLAIIILSFGVNNIYNNVFKLRLQTATGGGNNLDILIGYLWQQKLLTVVLVLGLFFSARLIIKQKEHWVELLILLIWVISGLGMLMFYRPLFLHHLETLVVPAAVLFSFNINLLLKKFNKLWLVPVLLIIVLILRLNYALKNTGPITNASEVNGINLVLAKTKPSDYIVSDDGIITGETNRLTPPNLVDLSNTRINSGNLTSGDFKNSLDIYKPKLVLVWSGRLTGLKDFDKIMAQNNYSLINEIDSGNKAYYLR